MMVTEINRDPALCIRLRDSEWLHLSSLQGTDSNLSVGITIHEGRLKALAQWTTMSVFGTACARFCLTEDRESVARMLTLARVAARMGKA